MKTAFICVCSPEYLPQYRVLLASIKVHAPEVDPILYYGGQDTPDGLEGLVNVHHWVTESKYTNDFYTYCSMRPRAILDAFKRGYERVVLLGADTEFFGHPSAISKLANFDAIVTTYIHEPYPEAEPHIYGNNLQCLENGQIQADFIGFRKSPQVIRFLKWVVEQTRTKCQISGKVYVDQGYLAMAFSFLDKVHVIRHPGYNVGSYCATMRGLKLEQSGAWTMANGQPLVSYHYDGFVKGDEANISKHQNRYKAEGDYLELLKAYGRRI